MKRAASILFLILLFLPFQTAAGYGLDNKAVTLTAKQVDGAEDIEAAIQQATQGGTRRGTVTLDGRDGAFVFTGSDRSINLFVSNLTLIGANQAVIQNCNDGLFIDDFPLKNILVEGIAFFCAGDGLEAAGSFQNVTLRGNMFQAGGNGIVLAGASSGWLIAGNVIQAGADGILMNGAQKTVVSANHVSGAVGISIAACDQSQVRQNAIQARQQGVLLGQGATRNIVQANTIIGASPAGIALQAGVSGNRVLSNRVLCASSASCQAVSAAANEMEMNTIRGNQP